jgi:hypothetical protein
VILADPDGSPMPSYFVGQSISLRFSRAGDQLLAEQTRAGSLGFVLRLPSGQTGVSGLEVHVVQC